MGKSPSPCFKIISCGADSNGNGDDLSPSESKQSSDKRRWSFRKKSARHQVPSNTVISEPQFVGYDKESTQASTDKFYSVNDSSVPAKPIVIQQANAIAPLSSEGVNSEKTPFLEQTDEPAPLSSAVVDPESPLVTGQVNGTALFSSAVVNSDVKVTLDTGKITTSADANLQEKVAVVIQAAARRFLAQRELQKLKNVVKLQAAVRGHLVRNQAIGTLRCVQAIAKMQALIRARRAHQCQILEKSSGQEKKDEEFWIDSVKMNSGIRSNHMNSTVEKLLSNEFARQLLESTPKTKPIHISCDPLGHDSAWQWLERWMAVTSSKVGQQQGLSCTHGYEGEKGSSNSKDEELDVNPVVGASILSGSEISPRMSAAAEGEGDSKADDNIGKFEPQAPQIVSEQKFSTGEGEKEHFQVEENIGMKEDNFTKTDRDKETSATSQSAHDNYQSYTDSNTQKGVHTTKPAASDSVDAEGKKFDRGSRKIRNPAFAAVQAKFEELSSAPKARSIGVCRDAAAESKQYHSQAVSAAKNKDLSSTESSTTQNPIVQLAASECGTEISISSTLDSPDRSETDGGEIVLEIRTSGLGSDNVNNSSREAFNFENRKAEAKILNSVSNEFQGERSREDYENMENSIAVKVEQQPLEVIVPGTMDQQENLKAQVYRSSPEGSPINHVIAPESHGTPSSQVSVQSKSSKSQNSIPVRKPKFKSGTKNSPSNVKNDSDGRSSTEHLTKDTKNANRQSLSGMAKLDHTDNEPRRSSSNSFPSYMQATESARAKAHGSVSSKSSPDVHDKDIHTKKKHSLPIGDGKQGSSPRVQRSASLTQQSSKCNNNQSPHGSVSSKSSPDVHDKDIHTKRKHSLPIGDGKQGSSPRVQRSASQTQQSSKCNNNQSPQGSAERRWQR